MVGDWDGDGDDTIGVYDPVNGNWNIRNSNSAGAPELSFGYGGGVWKDAIAGDWDGDGDDTIGVYDPAAGNWNLRNTNSAGEPNISFQYGGGVWSDPVVGDWDGDGDTTIGVHDPSAGNWNLRNANGAGAPDVSFQFGGGGKFDPLGADWDGDGMATAGLVAKGAEVSAPTATSGGATEVQEGQATLNGIVDAGASSTTYYFEYGTTSAYDVAIPIPTPSRDTDGGVSTTFTGVQPGSTYHYRLVAKNPLGTSYGKDRTVTLPGHRFMRGLSNGTSVSSWGAVINQSLPLESMAADFNGDGKADLVHPEWEGGASYRLRVGLSSGTAISSWLTPRTGLDEPERIAAGDFNGDGKADVVAVEPEGNGQYAYMLGIGNGASIAGWTAIATGRALPTRMALGDVTGDGKADVVGVEPEGPDTFRYVLGTSNGTGISSWTNVRTGSEYPFKTSLGDFNGDGKADVVSVEAQTGGTFRYMLGTSTGAGLSGWTKVLGGMAFPYKTALGDFTGDGKADIVSSEYESGSSFRYMLGTSSGTGVAKWGSVLTGVVLPRKMTLADFNGDGKDDIVAITSDSSGSYLHKVGFSNGTGLSSWSTVQTWMNKPSSAKLGDFNGDGKADLISAEPETSGNYRYRVGFSTGTGAISAWKTVMGGMTPPSWLGVGDVNGDGKADLVALEPDGSGKYRYMFGISSGTGISSWFQALGGMSAVSWMRVGDVNGDKKADIVAVESESGSKYRYMFGISSGSGISSWSKVLGGMSPAERVAVGDFTGDGKADVVSVEADGIGSYRYMLGVSSGTGISSWSGILGGMSNSQALDLGDVNGDKKADLISAEPEGEKSRFMYGISSGTGVSSWLFAMKGMTTPSFITAGDIDGDGKADFASLEKTP